MVDLLVCRVFNLVVRKCDAQHLFEGVEDAVAKSEALGAWLGKPLYIE
jgi:hypothetical protein